jgi:hypothetical protein
MARIEPAFVFLLASAVVACGGSPDDGRIAGEDLDVIGSAIVTCRAVREGGIDLEGDPQLKLTRAGVTLTLDVASDPRTHEGKRDASKSTATEVVYADFDGAFLPGFDKTLTVDSKLLEGAATGRVTLEISMYDDVDGEPTDPEGDSGAWHRGPGFHRHFVASPGRTARGPVTGTRTSTQAYDCTKK